MWYALILGGGSGSRMGANQNKVLLDLEGIPILVRSLQAFEGHVDGAVVVIRKEDFQKTRDLLNSWHYDSVVLVEGGETRQDSVYAGLHALPPACDRILVHDGARCLVDSLTIERCKESVEQNGSGVAAIPVTDTIKEVDAWEKTLSTPDRSGLRAVQTPQGFLVRDLMQAHLAARQEHYLGTDDASLLEHMGNPVQLVRGSGTNLKITHPEDLIVAAALLRAGTPQITSPLRIGYGYDVHQLVEGRKLILCGVEIPHTLGLLGHSDADVALHALMDALLGSVALGDIGHLFPDTDDAYQGISSMKLLSEVGRKLESIHASVVNCDVTIAAQKPKLAPYILLMRRNIADCLHIPLSCVSVKATTTEHLGFEGRMEGISASAVAMTMLHGALSDTFRRELD